MSSPRVRAPCALPLALALAALCSALGVPDARAARQTRRVAVLYFDNNTGNRKLDVLQKGFADMIVTDLSAVKQLAVVERERLQKLLEELKLQRSRYFDKRTALRLGKGLGAQYVVTGAFAAVEPMLRIDIRMIEIETSKVLLATKVTGKRSDLFELEQKLVRRFVSQLELTFRPPARPRTKVPGVKALLGYSKSLDLADRGKLEAADVKLATVIRQAPTFVLARIRRSALKKRLAAAAKRRRYLIGKRGQELYRNLQSHLKGHAIAKLSAADARTYLAYRVVEGWYALRALRQHLSDGSPKLVKPGHGAAARRLMKAYVASRLKLIKELAIYAKKHAKTLPNGYVYLDTSLRLPPADQRRAADSNFARPPSGDLDRAKLALARFALMGTADDGARRSSRFTVAPPLSLLVRRYEKLGYRLLAEVIRSEEAALKSKPNANEYLAIRARETYGDALLLRGKRKAAISRWQAILDRYPTSRYYKRIERRIKQQLGMVHHNATRKLDRYARGLKSCHDMDLRVGLGAILHRRLRISGIRALNQTIAEIEKQCRRQPKLRNFWTYLYSHTALVAGRHGYCKLFDKLMQRYLQAGGSARDARGYRKNYTSCR